MNAKETFIQALHDLPEGVSDFLEVPLPGAETCAVPDNIDDAIIAQGKLAKYLLDFFKAFEGLTPIPIFLRIGQHNPVIQSMLLAGLEYTGTSGAVEIIAPKDGGVYYGFFTDWEAKILRGFAEEVKASIEDNSEIMEGSGSDYSCLLPVPVGSHYGKVAASMVDGGVCYADVSFEVLSYADIPLTPNEGDSIAAGGVDFVVNAGESFENLSNVEVIIDDTSTSLSLSPANLYEGVIDLSVGTYQALFRFSAKLFDGTNEVIERLVTFEVT